MLTEVPNFKRTLQEHSENVSRGPSTLYAERLNHLHISAYSLLTWLPFRMSANIINSKGV